MRKISKELLAKTVKQKREKKKITQDKLSRQTGINRAMLSRIENGEYIPSLEQLEALGDVLFFEIEDILEKEEVKENKEIKLDPCKIAVAGTGYVGLSLATLLAQHNKVTAVDIVEKKVKLINNGISPIQDDYIEDYLRNKKLNLTAT